MDYTNFYVVKEVKQDKWTDLAMYFTETHAIEYSRTLCVGWGNMTTYWIYHYTRQYDGSLVLVKQTQI